MANAKISELPAVVASTTDDLVPVVQAGSTKSLSLGSLPRFTPIRRIPRPRYSLVPRGAAWTTSGAAVTSLDTANADPAPASATSVVVNMSGASGTKTLRYTHTATFDFTGKMPGFWLKVPDMNQVSSVSICLGDSALTNYFQFNAPLSGNKNVHSGQWNFITIPWAPNSTVGTPSRSAIQRVQFILGDVAGGTAFSWSFGDQIAMVPEPTAFPTGAVSLCFDDSFDLSLIAPKLAALNIPATLYPIGDVVGTGGKVTMAQLRMWVDTLGWEVAAHAAISSDHVTISGLTQAARLANLARAAKWLTDNGFVSSQYAYPNGASDEASFTDVRTIFSAARGTGADADTFPPSRPEYLRAYSTGPATTAANLQTQVDRAQAGKGWQIIVIHTVTTSPTGQDTSASVLSTFADYLATINIEKLTVSDAMARL